MWEILNIGPNGLLWIFKAKRLTVWAIPLNAPDQFSTLSQIALFGQDSLTVSSSVLCVQESFDGQMTEDNIEIGISKKGSFVKLTPAEIKDYLVAVL